jgi:putative ABC transport system permease protein
MPTLVTAVSWFGDRLPLAGRLAVRDAVRHRHRTVAAGAAVMVAVAGSVVAAFVFTSRADTEPRTLPADTALAQLDRLDKNGDSVDRERTLEQVATNATRSVPGVVVNEVTLIAVQRTPNLRYPIFASLERATPDCWSASAKVGIGTPEMIELVTGRKPDAGTRSALARGEVVVFDDKCLVNQDGTVTLGLNQEKPGRVPAHLGARAPGTEERDEYLPTAFISTETAEAHGWFPYPGAVTVTYRSPDDLDAVRAAAEDAGVDLYVSEAVGGNVTSLYLALAGVAALVAFLGAGMTVALAATDGRADLATLAALGAPPRRRRTLAGAQALVVTTLGTLAGVLLGVCAGYAAVPVAGLPSVSVPWQHLWLTVLAVPLLAAALAVLVTPSRLALRERS